MDPTGICEVFEDSIQIAQDDITFSLNPGEVDEPQEENKVLLGKIISRYKLGKAAIQGSLKLSWNAIRGWKWKEIENGILQFTFANRNDAMNVLARRPWFVCGALLVIMPWPAWLTPAEVRFDKTPIWVNIESIPPFYWNLSNLKEMATKASSVFDLPHGIEDAIGMSTLRFRATIDLNKPIFAGFFLRRQKLKDLWIQYKYEKLPKACFKCGLLTHDQTTCFKAPTVVKDDRGNFYPMFGIWLKKDAQEKSPFTTPLAKWFQDWVLQKRLGRDPTLRNQVKVQKALRHGDEAEPRESRMQFPGKRRIVTDSDEEGGSPTTEEVITQLPLVYLPGIGEFAPFGSNSKKVLIRDLIEAAEEYAKSKTENKSQKRKEPALCTNQPDDSTSNKADCQSGDTRGEDDNNDSQQVASPKPNMVQQGEINHISQLVVSSVSNESSTSGFKGNLEDATSTPYKESPLGSQAQTINWPSKEFWAQPKARELLMGSLTVDKYHREPTLFNPITSIEDFRVQEHLTGPRKRKASDGFILSPPTGMSNLTPQRKTENQPKETCAIDQQGNLLDSNTSNQSPTRPGQTTAFSPGSDHKTNSAKRRGRPKKQNQKTQHEEEAPPKKRGRPPKQKGLSTTPKSFKWRNKAKTPSGIGATLSNLWESRAFDLKVNLDNHFVCKITSSNKFVIHGEISSDPPGHVWQLLGMYAPPHERDKETFWSLIGDQVAHNQIPTLILGDLNGTIKDHECLNYSRRGNSSRYSFDLRRMVSRTGMVDLGFLGPPYTWSKTSSSHTHRNTIKKARLDRGLATTEWRLLFPSAVINHLPTMASDHRPILLDTNAGVNCKRRLFKYENMWARDIRSFWVVKEAWAGRLHENPMLNFHRKIKNTSRKLSNWNKKHFRRLNTQVKEASTTLKLYKGQSNYMSPLLQDIS
ncbi:hypothetical protein F8388_024237 [Cannabis sativa]|uniref:DUF4283 domain-containing protein n=1 Tax=Cannabis sativa TaxID=3483 RepID=A0A7J6DU09_CANSA|nr:hypothetical protein F8388_024237 [Cannabis sativa]